MIGGENQMVVSNSEPILEYDAGDMILSSTVADGFLYVRPKDGGVSALDIQQASMKLPTSTGEMK